jgi:GNAT superfamily N-acetyltransferase
MPPMSTSEPTFRRLGPDEASVLSEAIRVAYGESYDVRWVYDEAEVEARLAAETYVSWVAESAEGELLCHEGLSLAAADDAVGHSGQAVTMPAARGQHLFTRTKRHLMDWARERGLAGMYSEATAAHPYSQRANLELGAHETGFLLGWIPASVSNDAAPEQRPRRQSAALFYTKLNDGHERNVYAPQRHREIIRQTLELCELRGTLADPPPDAEMPERSSLHVEIDADHNLALLTAHDPGTDLEQVVAAERHHLFHNERLDAIYWIYRWRTRPLLYLPTT